MIVLPTARRRAEELDAAVSRRASGTTPAAPELAPLLDVVAQLRAEAATTAPSPRPDFSRDLRALLMAEADTALVPAAAPADDDRLRLPVHATPRRQRRVAAVAAAVVIAGTSSTMAYAAQDALPGDSLYPVKRALEGARGTISLTDEAKGTVTLRHAAQRLAEVEGLVARDEASSRAQVPGSLETFTDQADDAAALLLGAAADSGHTAPVVQVRSFVSESIAALSGLQSQVGDDAEAAFADAVAALVAIDEQALAQCAACGDDPLELPLSLSAAAALADEAGELPELPTLDLADLPPGSISGPGGTDPAPIEAPPAEPEAPSADTPAPSTPSPTTPPPTSPTLPDVPPILPPSGSGSGGTSGLVEGVTGLTGPLQEPLDQLTSPLTQTLDQLLGLGR